MFSEEKDESPLARLTVRQLETPGVLYFNIAAHDGTAPIQGTTGFNRNPEIQGRLFDYVADRFEMGVPAKPFRILFAPCSIGAEPYSFAMRILASNRFSPYACSQIEIHGVDINPAFIEIARAGIYPKAMLDRISKKDRSRFFSRADDGTCHLHDAVKDQVTIFDACDIRDHKPSGTDPAGHYDVIYMANLFYHLDDETGRAVFKAALDMCRGLVLVDQHSMKKCGYIKSMLADAGFCHTDAYFHPRQDLPYGGPRRIEHKAVSHFGIAARPAPPSPLQSWLGQLAGHTTRHGAQCESKAD